MVTPLPWNRHRFFAPPSVGSAASQQEEKKELFVAEFDEDGIEFGYVAGDAGEKIPAIRRRGGEIQRRKEVMTSMTFYYWDDHLKMWSV